jgi:hypothetical protein
MRRSFFALLLLVLACSAEQPVTTTTAAATKAPAPPTAAEARELIAKSPELSEHQFTNAGWTAPTNISLMSAPVRDEARDLAAAGWLSLEGEIGLTEKSRGDKRFVLRPNGLLDVVPLAKKEMGDVTATRNNADGTVAADFSWKWIPNEVGSSFKKGPVHDRFAAPQKSTATLMWDGTSWMILKIE